MSAEHSFKVLLVGDTGTGKTSFLKYDNQNYNETSNLFNSIGITFSKVDIYAENNNNYTLHFWDITGNIRYKTTAFRPNYYKNTDGCIMFFDTSNYSSFKNLPYWIKTVWRNAGGVPIILIGSKTDLNYEIYYKKIIKLVKKYHLDDFYFISVRLGFDKAIILQNLIRRMIYHSQKKIPNFNIVLVDNLYHPIELSFDGKKEKLSNTLSTIRESNRSNRNNFLSLHYLHPPPEPNSFSTNTNDNSVGTQHTSDQEVNNISSSILSLRDAMLAELERLREIMRGNGTEEDDAYYKLSAEEKVLFHKFLEFFLICPVCKKENHKSYLKKFYFDNDHEKTRLRTRLLNLISESNEFDEIYYNKISLGIPCCDCFKNIFLEH